jgi:hypothetical protein
MNRYLYSFLAIALLLPATYRPLLAQNAPDDTALSVSRPIERELQGDAAHSYTIEVSPGTYIHIVVEQRGIDVMLTLFAADGTVLAEVDSPNGTQGPEPLSIIATTGGRHRLEVRSLDRAAAAGHYEVKPLRSEAPRTAPGDGERHKSCPRGAGVSAGRVISVRGDRGVTAPGLHKVQGGIGTVSGVRRSARRGEGPGSNSFRIPRYSRSPEGASIF